jgi:membrane-associated phospholipid phosphatase
MAVMTDSPLPVAIDMGYIKYSTRMTMKETLARLTTDVVNPFLIGFIVIVLLAFKGTHSTTAAVKWASISAALSVLPVLVVVACLVQWKKLDGFFSSPRPQRTGIYLLASAFGALGYGLLWYLQAPELLAATFAAGLAAIVVFTGINLVWKISLHMAFLAGAVVILIIVYGAAAAGTLILLPLVAWSRMVLKQHSALQTTAGALIAAGIVLGVFWGYGLVG